MAPPGKDVVLVRSKSVSEIQCKQCGKTVVNAVKCYKCLEVFHPACMVQAASLKKTVCKHSADESDETRISIGNELSYLLKIVKELEEKNTLLEENCKLWKEKATCLEEQIKKTNQPTLVNKRTDLSVSSQKNSQIQGCNNDKDCSAVKTANQTLPNTIVANSAYPRLKQTIAQDNLPSKNVNSANVARTISKPIEIQSVVPDVKSNADESDVFDVFDDPPEQTELEFQRARRRRHEKGITKRKRNFLVGTNDDADNCKMFNMSTSNNRKIWLFISKVNGDVAEGTIKDYIAKRTNSKPDCISVKLCVPKEGKSKKRCFMIGVSPDLKDAIYDVQFWPTGVAFERFNFSRGKNFLD